MLDESALIRRTTVETDRSRCASKKPFSYKDITRLGYSDELSSFLPPFTKEEYKLRATTNAEELCMYRVDRSFSLENSRNN